ncbi:MotA/TolQ/ExbB proton channel family protein [Paludibaculum fermentans]|uniref:MotA/TolQ/ExbB proton channel family protein n=1 Tax=Paludibaculum fermentans TaxID=1473598 RepID=A0A7S7SM97_PALFE|nr:MotA/TolQ/ExbB proton channel family protein [Paludibaculum fermentans]QOY89286.1 MotA/TolQ/ExbB proton channel family protein [Paludibaculum fermentans]
MSGKVPGRAILFPVSLVAALVFIGVGSVVVTGRPAEVLFDHPSKHFPYPLTIQNIMHVVFFIGLGELFARWRSGILEEGHVGQRYLPEDEQTVLTARDLGPIRLRVAREHSRDHGFLPSLIDLSILQFLASKSVDQTATVMNSSLELIAHRVDMKYGIVRFIAWLVPTLGFIGTVYALGASLSEAGSSTGDLNIKEVAKTLGVGFDCTMVALAQSAILVFLMQLIQEKEETAVNLAGDYTLRNLINRLYQG